jgi:hypothetical protein
MQVATMRTYKFLKLENQADALSATQFRDFVTAKGTALSFNSLMLTQLAR